jgi:hypothetical protein
MDSDLIELVSTARVLRLAALAAPQDWPPAARSMCGLCLGLAANAEMVLKIVKAQEALIERLGSRVKQVEDECGKIRESWATEHKN